VADRQTAYVPPVRTRVVASKRSKADTADGTETKVKKQKKSKSSPEETGQAQAGPSTRTAETDGIEDEETDEDDNGALEDLVHETLAAKKPRQKAADTKYIPPNETSEDRDRRTLFLGNLPIEVAKSKPAVNQLKAHILTFAPGAKIESIRFRSVAFAAPTAALPDDEEGGEGKRQKRELERARKWKEEQEILKEGGKEAEEVDPSKSYLDTKGKRKVAFIKKDVSDQL
jgi:nucleolar protein 12